MFLRRTSFMREKPTFSGISRAYLKGCSSEQAMDEPGRSAAAAVAGEALAVDPVAATLDILDSIIIAQPGGRGLAPPFGRDPLGPLGAGDVVHRASPHEPPRHAFRSRIDDVDRLGPVEQALWARKPLSPWPERGWGEGAVRFSPPLPSAASRLLPSPASGGGTSYRRYPPARPLRQMALLLLWPPHA